MASSTLPLTAFEHYMWTDDTASHPMTFWLRLTLAGTTAEAALVAAVEAAVQRHPLLRSTVRGRSGARLKDLHWQPVAGASIYIHIAAQDVPLTYPSGGGAEIDLSRECGIRLFVRQGQGRSVWSLQIHHAVADGIGAAKFLDDVLAYYGTANAGLGAEVPLRPTLPELLPRRGGFHLSRGQRRRRLWQDLWEGLRFFSRFPEPATTSAARPAKAFEPRCYPASVAFDLAGHQLAALKSAAKGLGGTVNDLLLRDLFLALDTWHLRHGRRRRLRLCMPINMRRGDDGQMPAANVIGMAFLHRQGSLLGQSSELLRSIIRDTMRIKRRGVGFALVFFMELFGRVRRGMDWLLSPPSPWACFATAVLSNLGEVMAESRLERSGGEIRAGDLTLVRIELLPPVRPHTAFAVGVVTYGGRLAVTLHYDHTVVEAAEAQALLSDYAQHLFAYAAGTQLPHTAAFQVSA